MSPHRFKAPISTTYGNAALELTLDHVLSVNSLRRSPHLTTLRIHGSINTTFPVPRSNPTDSPCLVVRPENLSDSLVSKHVAAVSLVLVC